MKGEKERECVVCKDEGGDERGERRNTYQQMAKQCNSAGGSGSSRGEERRGLIDKKE